MYKKNYNIFYFNNNIINDKQYEVLVRNIIHSTNTEDRNILCNYFINNKYNTNINYRPHISPIQKITKSYTIQDIQEKIYKIYNNKQTTIKDINIPITIEEKLDGIMLNIVYYNGKLQSAITRGDCYGGEDLIEIMIKILPKTIEHYDALEIRGELVMLKSAYIKDFQEYASQRHATLSIISKKSFNPIHLKKLRFYAHDLGIVSKKILQKSQNQTYKYLQALNINTVHYIISNIKTIEQDFAKIQKQPDNNLIKDGYIIKVDNIQQQIDNFEKYSQESSYCFAYKEITTFTTTIKKIELNFSKNGACAPIAHIYPHIKHQNIICSKINLYSYSFIKKHTIGINTKIQVIFNAIFIFHKVLKKAKSSFIFPKNCPICNSILEVLGLHLYCTNISCKNRIINTLTILCKQIGIQSISKQTITALITKNIIKNITDIFNINNYIHKLITLEGFKDKKITNLAIAINKSIKKISLEQIILCFGIPNIGIKTANNIAKEFQNKKEININTIYNMEFLNKKQKEEVGVFLKNKYNILTIKKMLNMLKPIT